MMDRRKLMEILEGEAMARCRYEIYGEIARREGLHYYAKIFEETARNELSHVRELMTMLGLSGSTISNLETASQNEALEATRIYPGLSEDSVVAGDLDTARFFQQVAKIEQRHLERFEKLHELLENDSVFHRDKAIIWKCRVCGYIHEGTQPPKKCPSCRSTQNCFEPDDFSI